jgi:hypothetical protein
MGEKRQGKVKLRNGEEETVIQMELCERETKSRQHDM